MVVGRSGKLLDPRQPQEAPATGSAAFVPTAPETPERRMLARHLDARINGVRPYRNPDPIGPTHPCSSHQIGSAGLLRQHTAHNAQFQRCRLGIGNYREPTS